MAYYILLNTLKIKFTFLTYLKQVKSSQITCVLNLTPRKTMAVDKFLVKQLDSLAELTISLAPWYQQLCEAMNPHNYYTFIHPSHNAMAETIPHHQPTKIFSSVGQDFLQPMHLSDALLKSEKHLSKHNYLTSHPRNTGPSSEHASPPCYPSKATSSDEGGQSKKKYLLLSLIHAVLKLPFKDQDKRNKNKRATLGSFFSPHLAIITVLRSGADAWGFFFQPTLLEKSLVRFPPFIIILLGRQTAKFAMRFSHFPAETFPHSWPTACRASCLGGLKWNVFLCSK